MASHAGLRIARISRFAATAARRSAGRSGAARDAGLPSVACTPNLDAESPHVRLADEAFALGGCDLGVSPSDFVLDAAAKSSQRHPPRLRLPSGKCRISARAVIVDAGLIWIGPSLQSIRDLGDKVTARQRPALRRPWCRVPDPVKGAERWCGIRHSARACRSVIGVAHGGGKGHEGGPGTH